VYSGCSAGFKSELDAISAVSVFRVISWIKTDQSRINTGSKPDQSQIKAGSKPDQSRINTGSRL